MWYNKYMKKYILFLMIFLPFSVFASATTLVTNEYAYRHPADPKAIFSSIWEMTSGSLFLKDGKYWTGVPDNKAPNYNSTTGNNSVVFRATTKATYVDETTEFDFVLNNFTSTKSTPKVNWDGGHIFLRYQSEFNLYYASFARRDGNVVIKKKCDNHPNPDSNFGIYYDLSTYNKVPVVMGTVSHIKAQVQNVGAIVKIDLYKDSKLVASAVDTGIGCPTFQTAGKTGVRGDNANFYYYNFSVN